MAKAHLLVVSLALILPACGRAAPHSGFVARAAPGVTVIHGDAAQAAGLEGQRVQLPVADAPDSYAMLTSFLRTVHAHGAAFVSDIEVHVVAPRDGAWQECVTRLEPIDHGRAKVQETTEPGHWVVADKVHLINETSGERRAVCTDVAPSSGPNSAPPSCIIVTGGQTRRVESSQGWVWQPAQTRVERTWVSDWRLDPMAPACKPTAAAAPTRSIQATVYGAL